MGMDIDGGMLVGAHGDKLAVPKGVDVEFYEWADENGLESYAMHYDADQSHTYYGFPIDDVRVSGINGEWLESVKDKAAKFEALTGVEPSLIGAQSVW